MTSKGRKPKKRSRNRRAMMSGVPRRPTITGTVSAGSGEGRHTTVNSVMLDLPGGGAVVDSPGVRDYAPAIEKPEEVVRGFRELSELGEGCRFANCLHLREPDCAVKTAVDNGTISARRYESYRRLLALSKDLADKKY